MMTWIGEGGGCFSPPVGLQVCSFHLPLPQQYRLQACLEETEKSFTPRVYNIANRALVSLILNLTGIIKVKKNIFMLKESIKALFNALFKKMKEKPWKWRQGIPLAQLNKRSKGEKLCEIILHLELNLHSNSIYGWMNDADQLKGSELHSPSLLLDEKIQSRWSKYSLKIPPSAWFFFYSNFMFMQFQFVKGAWSFMTTYKENNILFEGHACILRSRNTNADPAEEGTDFLLRMYLNKGNSVYSLFWYLKILCLVSSKSIIIHK